MNNTGPTKAAVGVAISFGNNGAVASDQQVIANVGGNLNIESLQDTSTYHSKDENIGGSVTVGFSGSVNYSNSNSKVDGDFASVTEQSGKN